MSGPAAITTTLPATQAALRTPWSRILDVSGKRLNYQGGNGERILVAYTGCMETTQRTLDLDASPAPFLAIEVRKGDARLKFFATLTSLGTPYDITLHELRIESFFSADDATDAVLRRLPAAS